MFGCLIRPPQLVGHVKQNDLLRHGIRPWPFNLGGGLPKALSSRARYAARRRSSVPVQDATPDSAMRYPR